MGAIHQNDQFRIPFVIKLHGTEISPEMVDDVRIKIGDKLKTYSEGELNYNSEAERWEYPLSAEHSRKLNEMTTFQVQVKLGDKWYGSDSCRLNVSPSIIKEDW